MNSDNNRNHDFSLQAMSAKDIRKMTKYLYPKQPFQFRWILLIFLAALVIFLDVYAWLFADRSTFGGMCAIGFMICILLPVPAPASFRRTSKQPFYKVFAWIVVLVCIFVSLLGVRTIVSPKYRARVAEEKITKQVELSKKIAIERHVASIIAAIGLPEECSSEYRTGKMLIAFNGYQPSSDTGGFDLDESIVTQNMSEASTIVWIESTSTKYGEYHADSASGMKTGDALIITWRVWLIDLKSRTVIAYRSFNGPYPPEKISFGGDYGVSPIHFVEEWLNNMPFISS